MVLASADIGKTQRCESRETLLPPRGLKSDMDTTVPSCLSDGELTSAPEAGTASSSAPRAGVQIICVGLMRTGLKTLHEALRVLGHAQIYDQEQITSTYELWSEVMENRHTQATFTNIFQGANVVMGMPVFCFWEEILREYPDAKVILTVRDEDEWLESVERAKSHMDHDLPGVPLTAGSLLRRVEHFLVPSYHKFCEVLRFSWSSSLGMLDTQLNRCCVLNNYRKHNHYVEAVLGGATTAEGHPQLLVYDVRDGWEPLCKFLRQEVPEVEFPTVMNVPYFGKEPAGPEGMRLDQGGEFQDILVPDSAFGIRLRSELRRGLTLSLLAVAAVMAPAAFAVQQMNLLTVSPMALTIIFLIVSCVGWNVYIVMHTLVMRVPAAVVLPMALKSLLIAASLHACYITYGILKEQIVTQDKIASPVLILATRLMSVLCAAVAMLVTEGKVSFEGPPIHHFFAFGLSNELSTWAGYAVLSYVSFPVQIMAKSCKMLPSMLMGRVVNKTQYRMSQYLQAVGAMICVTIMHLSEEGGAGAGQEDNSSEDSHLRFVNALLGVSLLGVFFVADGFTSQWQTALYKKHPELTQTKMMFMGNLFGLLITLASIASRWSTVSRSLSLAYEHPEILGRILCLGLSGAMGQFCIYTAIKLLGSLAFTWIMTARQLLSVLISLVLFGHGVSPLKLLCIMTVFAIMSAKQLQRALPQAVQAVQVLKTASALTRSLSTASWDMQPLRRLSTRSLGSADSIKKGS